MKARQGPNGSLSQPATAHSGSPTTGIQLSTQAGAPKRLSQFKARSSVAPPTLTTTLGAPRPSHQINAPPSALPAVAARMVGQNSAGLSLMRPKTANSEPSGGKVAEMTDTTNTVLKPNCGRASHCNN